MIWTIIYILIGFVICKYYWDKDYRMEYYQSKQDNNVDKGIVQLLLSYYIFFWPIAILYRIIQKIIN